MSQFKNLPAPVVQSDEPSELHPELLGISAVNPLVANTSASRLQMVNSHLAQSLSLEHGGEARRLSSGLEGEFGKYTYQHQMPCDGKIILVQEKYPSKMGSTIYKGNPETFVMIECDPSDDECTWDYDCLVLNENHFTHEEIGFKYKKTKNWSKLHVGANVRRGQAFLTPPSISDDGWYNYGVNANVVMITDPAGAEDGMKVRRGFLEKLRYTTYERVVISYGRNTIALNVHGKNGQYQPFPNVGDTIPQNGVVGATRRIDTDYVHVDLTNDALKQPIEPFDSIVYAKPGGTVVDITTVVNPRAKRTEDHIEHAHLYDVLHSQYIASINDFFESQVRLPFVKRHGREPRISHALQNFLVHSKLVMAGKSPHLRVALSVKKEPLDNVYISVLIRHSNLPTFGSKITDINGGKGVVVSIVDDKYMPCTDDGLVADVVSEPSIGRMNVGRLYEPYVNASGLPAIEAVCQTLGVQSYSTVDLTGNPNIEQAFDLLNYYYAHFNPNMDMRGKMSLKDMQLNLEHVVRYGTYVIVPTNNPYKLRDIQMALSKSMFAPKIEPMWVSTPSGQRVKTKQNVLIGQLYMVLLQQTGSRWSATSSARVQIHGLICPKNRNTKTSHPYNDQGVRFWGQSEGRIATSYMGKDFAAVNHDMNNNPVLHEHVCGKIASAPNPMQIDNVREGFDFSECGNVPVNMMNHYLAAFGYKFTMRHQDGNFISREVEDIITEEFDE